MATRNNSEVPGTNQITQHILKSGHDRPIRLFAIFKLSDTFCGATFDADPINEFHAYPTTPIILRTNESNHTEMSAHHASTAASHIVASILSRKAITDFLILSSVYYFEPFQSIARGNTSSLQMQRGQGLVTGSDPNR